MDMNSLIEKSQIGKWMKQSGKTLDDLDKYEKYEYEQTINILKIMMKQRDMVANATPRRSAGCGLRNQFKEENAYHLMPELLDKIIDLELDIGVTDNMGVAECFSDNDGDLIPGFHNGRITDSSRRKIACAGSTFKDLSNLSTPHNDIPMYIELAERIRDVNTELICLKEDFKLETKRNKTQQDNNEIDIYNILSRIEKQEEKNKKQTEMIIYNRIVIGLMMIVYITFEFYKNYNFESREDVCQVKQITHN